MATRTYTSVDLAVDQLNTAIGLFLNRQSYVSALTLAGAAEELIGKTLSNVNLQNSTGGSLQLSPQNARFS
jgi:hypothetical protein